MEWTISFDIGIKHLAYCILKKTPENKIEITDWEVLDVSHFERNDISLELNKDISCQTCTCSLEVNKKKTKKNAEIIIPVICKKKAKYRKGISFFCEKHAKEMGTSMGFYLPSKEFNITFIKKQKMDFIAEFERKYGIQSSLEKPQLLKNERITRIEEWIQIHVLETLSNQKLGNKTIKKEIGLVEIGRNMANQLSSIDMSSLETVLIENQISPIANKMKTIQGMLAQIFILQGIERIEFISSRNKLKGFSREKTESNTVVKEKEGDKVNINPNYKQHKKDGIQYCRELLEREVIDINNRNRWKIFFETFPKKQDDLADAFLQGFWYLSQKPEKDKKENNNSTNMNINNVV
jgi:hypothetical protein